MHGCVCYFGFFRLLKSVMAKGLILPEVDVLAENQYISHLNNEGGRFDFSPLEV